MDTNAVYNPLYANRLITHPKQSIKFVLHVIVVLHGSSFHKRMANELEAVGELTGWQRSQMLELAVYSQCVHAFNVTVVQEYKHFSWLHGITLQVFLKHLSAILNSDEFKLSGYA